MTDPTKDITTNPGVQGLAQLGRNALERIAQLERELVEARRDTERLEWVMPILDGGPVEEANRRGKELGYSLCAGAKGRAAIDAAMKEVP